MSNTPMTLNPDVNHHLIARIDELMEQFKTDHPGAQAQVQALIDRMNAGDEAAEGAVNTLTIRNFQTHMPDEWAATEEPWNRISRRDPDALHWAKAIQDRAKAGDLGAQRLFSMLLARSKMATNSAFAPDSSDLSGNVRIRSLPDVVLGPPLMPELPEVPKYKNLAPRRPTLAEEFANDPTGTSIGRERSEPHQPHPHHRQHGPRA